MFELHNRQQGSINLKLKLMKQTRIQIFIESKFHIESEFAIQTRVCERQNDVRDEELTKFDAPES